MGFSKVEAITNRVPKLETAQEISERVKLCGPARNLPEVEKELLRTLNLKYQDSLCIEQTSDLEPPQTLESTPESVQ